MKTSSKRLFSRAILTGAVALASVSAMADQLADIKAKGELVCGVLGTDRPFSFMKNPADREIVGYDVDFCNAIAKALGVKPVLKQLATAARIPELQQKRVDILTASLTHTKDRESQIDFTLSTFVLGEKALVRKDSGITHLAQLDGKKVITTKGSTEAINIPKILPKATLIEFDTNPEGILALQQGKGVAYIDDETTLAGALVKLGPAAKDYVILPENLSEDKDALGVRKDEPVFKAKVNEVLSAMEKSGEAQKIYDRWFGAGSGMNFPPRSFKIDSDQI
ncbi:ABC transporter substrate-binding protein [Paraburkholderia susongensis]|uniref:Amino acid ABC transporter substrate-binding protein, PAAT family n=1 Tax=Paraburkholderia susongensis TaxID=1515439 RepID=A0A1X7LIT3_9BURK|nr:ABC transporter substrate-binding protein [Paraburkholderia susongensis]SMG53695.1 amino acid ABC transporter substrate-binding protein, PAAT family [Paraburkholderia susongensis]